MLTERGGGQKCLIMCLHNIWMALRSPTSGTDFTHTSWSSLCHRHLCRHLWGHLSRHLHRPGAEYLHRGTPRVASITPCASPPVPQHAQASAILRDLGRGSLCRDVPWGTRKTGMHEYMIYMIYGKYLVKLKWLLYFGLQSTKKNTFSSIYLPFKFLKHSALSMQNWGRALPSLPMSFSVPGSWNPIY